MKTIREQEKLLTFPYLCEKACIIFLWITVLYSLVFQYMVYAISNGMLLLGIVVMTLFMLSQTGKPFSIKSILTPESTLMLLFLAYMFPIGLIMSPVPNLHISQWITCLEYMFLLIVISSIVMHSGTDTFYLMLLVTAVILVFFFLKSPVNYKGSGRYSVSNDVNPNSLGMIFTEGIWAILYFQQKKKTPIVIVLLLIGVLCYGIIMTGSRKSLIATGIIIIIWYICCYLFNIIKGNSPWKSVVLVSSVLLLIALGLLFVRLYSGSNMAARMGELEYETQTGTRSDMYVVGWNIFRKYPLFGLGFQGYKYIYGDYSHATVVEVPVSGGICGSIIYFGTFFLSIRRVARLWKCCKDNCKLTLELYQIKMLMAMWVAMLFYCICVIHPYQFDSYIVFGIMFGQTANIEKKVMGLNTKKMHDVEKKCKWIK